jgi:hypothetical protein
VFSKVKSSAIAVLVHPRPGGFHHGVKLRNPAVQIPHVGLGQRDLLRERCRVMVGTTLSRLPSTEPFGRED